MSNVVGSMSEGKPLRVCMVAPSLDILGGQAVQAARLLSQLKEVPGLQASLLPINPRLPGPLRLLQRVKYVRTLVTSISYLANLLRHLPSQDVVHVFSASYLSFVLAPTPAILVARLYGKSTILNYHSGEAEDHLQRWRRTAIPTIRLVDRIIVPSGYLVGVFGRFGLSADAIPNIVDLDRYRFRVRRPLRPVFLTNRNLEPHYNVGCVLRAFKRIQERHRDARLTVAGDGSQRGSLRSLAARLALRNVQFVGSVPVDRMTDLYDSADIYLNGSDIDNMPVSIIEAFASGLPVVTTNAGGIPYMVRDGTTGLLVGRGDDEAMAEAAIRLLCDEGLALGIAERARRECEERYGWEAVRDAWLRLYEASAGRDRVRASAESSVPSAANVRE